MTSRSLPSEESIKAIVGHQFPGGEYTIEHWENFLLTECTGADLLPGGMVHPVALFHVPILGCGTTIAEMFALGQADSDFSIGIESYNWEMFKPLQEDVPYTITGSIIDADRREKDGGRIYDRIQFEFNMAEPDSTHAARITVTWHYNRGLS